MNVITLSQKEDACYTTKSMYEGVDFRFWNFGLFYLFLKGKDGDPPLVSNISN